MNPLGNGNLGGLPPQMMNAIQQAKQMMGLLSGNPQQMIQNNPMLNQIMQQNKGKTPEQIFRSMAQQRGIDPDEFLRQLRNN